ncbi:MAG: hypothetical protein OCU24_06600 [Candidatus Methanospirare jalkutatii]|nr:hypothetical protein [Candidatus Methanospirare jalkutatii]
MKEKKEREDFVLLEQREGTTYAEGNRRDILPNHDFSIDGRTVSV